MRKVSLIFWRFLAIFPFLSSQSADLVGPSGLIGLSLHYFGLSQRAQKDPRSRKIVMWPHAIVLREKSKCSFRQHIYIWENGHFLLQNVKKMHVPIFSVKIAPLPKWYLFLYLICKFWFSVQYWEKSRFGRRGRVWRWRWFWWRRQKSRWWWSCSQYVFTKILRKITKKLLKSLFFSEAQKMAEEQAAKAKELAGKCSIQ